MAAKRNFEEWLETFKESIADYKYYVDFDAVYRNCGQIKVELNILNSLVGSKNIEEDFEKLILKYPETLKCIPILLAKREFEIPCTDENGSFKYDFKNMNQTVEQYRYFMKETGLFDLLQNHIIKDLVDYVTGVESGLSSNGRKNRGGHLMEDLVEVYIKKAGYVKGRDYFDEMYLDQIEKKFDMDLSALSNNGDVTKRFDYVIYKNNCVYAMECNFYSSSGSKVNEVARSYKTLAIESKNVPNFEFMWITDGVGWKSARHNLKETFDVLDYVYNLSDLESGVFKTL